MLLHQCVSTTISQKISKCNIQTGVGYVEAGVWQFWKNKKGEIAFT